MGFQPDNAEVSFDSMKTKIHQELKKSFNPEFLNRVDEVVIFHPLDRKHIEQIVDIQLQDVQKR
jgi:ATP-dependent Clp protease ATP-binding subunit ClpC